ncbi:hypothetical protein EB796_008421 [Bugula neritina]|uniref:Uncharacterized protein n=1 Tax=Bugula neritina TaxID=10212 RepID=A0A7J7K517_BUGNE|nr:hypothetical protein EB796_008421 [Bugula neritina]
MIEQLLKTLGSDWLTIFLSVSFCLTLYFWWSSSSPGKPPPGPTGLPFLGILPEFVRSARSGALIEFCMNMNRKYGRIVMFKSGSQNLVWLGDGKLVTKLFNSEEFALRPIDTLPVLKIISGGSPKGIIFTNGEITER